MNIFYFLLIFAVSLLNAQNKIEIKNAWLRPGAEGMNTALYFDIHNLTKQPDTLYKAECNVSKVVELHETFIKGEMMGMRKTDYVVVKRNSVFNFKPGGNHIMLIDLKKKLKAGENYKADLFFKTAGKIRIKVQVKR